MNPDALLLAIYYRHACSLKRTFIASERAGHGSEYFRHRIQTLNQIFEIHRPELSIESLADFPDACICGSIRQGPGILRLYCPDCWDKKTSRPAWEIQDFTFVFWHYFKCSSPVIANLYYAKAISIESKRLSK